MLLIFKLPFPNGSYHNGVCRAIWAKSELETVQLRESKLRTKDNAQAHKSSSEFEIAALFQIIKERQFQIQSYFYELEHYSSS